MEYPLNSTNGTKLQDFGKCSMGYVQLSSLSQKISKKPYETNSFCENNYTFAPSIFTNKGLH